MAKAVIGRGSDQFPLRLPDGMRERIKDAAAKSNRSMNAEIVAALEEKFPPRTIDVDVLAEFLDYLTTLNYEDDKDKIESINDLMGKSDKPWTVKAGWDGIVTFYPYPTTRPKPEDKE